jgi:hypothetical protein
MARETGFSEDGIRKILETKEMRIGIIGISGRGGIFWRKAHKIISKHQ